MVELWCVVLSCLPLVKLQQKSNGKELFHSDIRRKHLGKLLVSQTPQYSGPQKLLGLKIPFYEGVASRKIRWLLFSSSCILTRRPRIATVCYIGAMRPNCIRVSSCVSNFQHVCQPFGPRNKLPST